MSNILIGEDEKVGRKHRMQKGDTGNKKTGRLWPDHRQL